MLTKKEIIIKLQKILNYSELDSKEKSEITTYLNQLYSKVKYKKNFEVILYQENVTCCREVIKCLQCGDRYLVCDNQCFQFCPLCGKNNYEENE